MPLKKLLAAGAAAIAALALALPAAAATSVRIEWLKGDFVYSGETISSSGVSAASSATPNLSGTAGKARVTVVSGAAVVMCCGSAPVATQANGFRLEPGMVREFTVSTGDKLAVIEATDAQSTFSVGGAAAAVSTNASTTVTTGGAYQTVFASSTTRKGCTIQNPTTATEILNVRVKSVAVFTVPIGGTFTCGAPGVVISDLVEVTAATTAHAFTAVSQ